MTINNPNDIRRIAIALNEQVQKIESQIRATKLSICPNAPEMELVTVLGRLIQEKQHSEKLRNAAFFNLEKNAIHEKANS